MALDLDTVRSSALSSIRQLAQLEAAAEGNRLNGAGVGAVFRSAEFTSAFFRLLDLSCEGIIYLSDVINRFKVNLGCIDSPKLLDLLQLFESYLQLTVSNAEGRLTPRDVHKALSSNESLATKVFEFLSGDDQASISVDDLVRWIANVTLAGSLNQISAKDLDGFARTFRKCCTDKNKSELTREEFANMVSSKKKFFVDRAFKIFDRSGSGKVSLDEYNETLGQLVGHNTDGAIKFLFRVYDDNGDGCLEEHELRAALKASMEESGMIFDSQELDDLTHALWEDAGMLTPDAKMTLDDLKEQLQKHPGLAEGLADSICKWCSPPERTRRRDLEESRRLNLKNYLVSNNSYLLFMCFFVVTNIVLFVFRAYVFSDFRNCDRTGPNVWVMLARANGIVLNLNSMLVLVFILRYTITFLRKLGFVEVLPLDQHIHVHKLIGTVIVIQAYFHGIMHFINFDVNVYRNPVRFLVANVHYAAVNYTLTHNFYNLPDRCEITSDGNGTRQKCDPELARYSYWDWMLTTKPGLFGLLPGWANITGVILILALTIMAVCSMPSVRRSGHFEVFYYSHLLYNVYFVLLILHAPSCWTWMIVPLVIFALEKAFRYLAMTTGYLGQSVVTQGIVLPSKVTGLVIKKPPNFRYVPGDWCFVKIPAIANFEWHPFTISSSPDDKEKNPQTCMPFCRLTSSYTQQEFFTLHIRGVGGWTNRLYDFFAEEYKRQQEGVERPKTKLEKLKGSIRRSVHGLRKAIAKSSGNNTSNPELERSEMVEFQPYKNLRRHPSTVRYSSRGTKSGRGVMKKDVESGRKDKTLKEQQRATLLNPLTIYIDGPFGAPASNFFRAKHAVIVATGIGVTPFSSILQSIMHRFWANKRECPNCQHRWNDELSSIFSLTKLEIEQAEKGGVMERFLEMHMYMTSALCKTDLRAVGLQLALDLLHEKEKRDLVTGLKARTKAGRPDWDEVFHDLKAQKKGPVTVFYCGAPPLAPILKQKCEEFGFTFRKETF